MNSSVAFVNSVKSFRMGSVDFYIKIFEMSAYPPALASVLKAAPCVVMSFYASYVFYVVMHGMSRHSQDHVPKFAFRSTKLERMLRFRDEQLRKSYMPKLTEDPNLVYQKSINNLF